MIDCFGTANQQRPDQHGSPEKGIRSARSRSTRKSGCLILWPSLKPFYPAGQIRSCRASLYAALKRALLALALTRRLDVARSLHNFAKVATGLNSASRCLARSFGKRLRIATDFSRSLEFANWYMTSASIAGHKRETARCNKMQRAVLFSSREFRSPVELFLASVAEWDAHVSHLVLAA